MERNHIYQYSIVNALMAGVAGSGIAVSELTKKGHQGIGTFIHVDGEMIMLDSRVYQLRGDGSIREAGPTEELPYAVATNFVADTTVQVNLESKESVDEALHKANDHAANLFMSYRIDGRFKHLKCRTVRGQEFEGQSLAELGKKQRVEEYDDISGTIVGFLAPASWQGFFVAGEHMHFVDDERKVGGHVLELKADGEVSMGIATVNNVHIELPTNKQFNEAKMTTDDRGLKGVEG